MYFKLLIVVFHFFKNKSE